MNNKKGFTLTELLAVLVLLAVISLIVVPIVLGDIYKSREKAHIRSIENYGREVEKAYVEAKMNKGSIPTTLSEMKDLIKYSGDTVTCDEDKIIIINDKIELYNCYVGDETKQKSKHKYNYIDGKLEEVVNEKQDDKTYKEYGIGNEIYDKTNNEMYHVIENSDSKQDYVVALKDEPLSYDEVNSYDSEHVTSNGYWGKEVGAINHNGYAAVSYFISSYCYTTDHSGEHSNGCKSNYEDSNIRYIVDLWSTRKFQNNELNGQARLITYNEYQKIINYDWKVLNYNQNTAYWTKSQYDNNQVWIVKNNGSLVHWYPYNNNLIRPVINLRKEYIK